MTIDTQGMKERLEHKQAELQELIQDLNGEPFHIVHRDNRDETIHNNDVANELAVKRAENSLVSNEVRLLSDVQEALKRIASGTYGVCTMCGQPIPEKRLEALPWAALCLKDQQRFEREHVLTR